jgi:hypothetical protein
MSVTFAPRARMAVKRPVPRGIDEGDELSIYLSLVGTDGLGDSTGFLRGHVGLADAVKERGFPVVDMAEHRYYRRPRLPLGRSRLLHHCGRLAWRFGLRPLPQKPADDLGLLLGNHVECAEVRHAQLLQGQNEVPGGHAQLAR